MTRKTKDHPSDQPSGGHAPGVERPGAPLAPGDEAAAGTPGTGENICRRCGGKGRIDGGVCPECEGSGKVIEGVGGA
jgi:hypothetical protein